METGSEDESRLIDTIYEAALVPDRWSDVMGGLGRVLRSHTAAVIAVGTSRGGAEGIFSTADRTSSIVDYQGRWAKGGPHASPCGSLDILRAGARLAVGAVRSDTSLMCRRELERSTFYNEHLLRFDFVHAFAAKLWETPGGYGVLSLSRSRQSGAFTDEDLARYDSLQRHLRRALAMAEHLSWSRIGDRDGEAPYRDAGCPALLVDGSGTCGWPNRAAEGLLQGGGGLRLVRGRLRTGDPAMDLALSTAVARAIARGSEARRGLALRIQRGADRPPLAAVITPVRPGGDWFLPHRPHAIVAFFDPEARPVPSLERLRALYGLTASEAAVAQGIARGLELAAVASDLGLTVNTARQYLTRAYDKTRTVRQNDLTRLLAGLARLP